jgi:DME family drug/metabolite transporter
VTGAPSASGAGALFVVTGAALFGTIGTARVLGPEAPAGSVAAIRLLVAAVLFLALAMPSGLSSLGLALRLRSIWVAGLAQAAFNLTFLSAVTRAGVAVGTLVAIGCTPILTGLLARQVSRGWLAATGLAMAGLVALLSDGLDNGVTVAGVVLALGASLSYASFILASSDPSHAHIALSAKLAAIFVIAAVALAPAAFTYDASWVATGSGLAMVAYMAIAGTIVAYNCFNRGLRTVAAGTAATLGLTEPLVAALLGVVVVGERLGVVSWVGAAIVFASLLMMVRLSQPSRPVAAGVEA